MSNREGDKFDEYEQDNKMLVGSRSDSILLGVLFVLLIIYLCIQLYADMTCWETRQLDFWLHNCAIQLTEQSKQNYR